MTIIKFSEGDKLWEECKKSTGLRYHMSQTEANLQLLNADLAFQQTNIEADSNQSSQADDVPAQIQPQPKRRAKGRREPSYYFQDELDFLRQEKAYQKRVEESKLHSKLMRGNTKNSFKTEHEKILKMVGPKWFQEPSIKQRHCAENLKYTIEADLKNITTRNTMFLLIQLGILPVPHPRKIWKALNFCEGDSVEFLLTLQHLMNPESENYSINDRILLSAVTHLALPETLREMHVRIPSPPPKPKQKKKKEPKPRQEHYESPYLIPFTFKPAEKKIFTISKNIRPYSSYFAYEKELRKMLELPEKSEYRYKYKAEQRLSLTMEAVKKRIELPKDQGDVIKEVSKTKPKRSSKVKKISTSMDPKKDIVTAVQLVNKKHDSRAKNDSATIKKKKKKITVKKVEIDHFASLDKQPTHYIVQGIKMTDEGPIQIMGGISKMDHHIRFFNYVCGGIAILHDGTAVKIIQGIMYEPFPKYCTYVIGGVKIDERGDSIKLITSISAKPFPDGPTDEIEIPPKPFCPCITLYHEYMRLKKLEHEKCLNVYRDYIVKKQRKQVKANPEITFVVGGVTDKEDGPVYMISGIKPPKEEMYEKIISDVVPGPNDTPTFIVSGITATRLYYEYMESVREGIANMNFKDNAYIVDSLKYMENGTPAFVISGVALTNTPARQIGLQFEGVKDDTTGTVIVTDECVQNPWFKDKYTYIISGVTTDPDGQPIFHIQGMQKLVEEPPNYTYVLGGVQRTESGSPLFVISGVVGGKEKVKEAFTPKCQYVIGGVKKLPNGSNTFIIQGLVLEREEIPQPCTYVHGGIRQMRDGTMVTIINGCVPEKEADCPCSVMYRTYMKIQAEKHKYCMSLYKRYIKRRDKMEKLAFEERKRNGATYIIGDIRRNPDGTPLYLISGLAAKKLYEEYIKTPIMPEPQNVIVAGIKQTSVGPELMIGGITTAGADRRPEVIVGGVHMNPDGTPTYIIAGVQAVPHAAKSIHEIYIPPKYTPKKPLLIIGGVQRKNGGAPTYIITGVSAIPSAARLIKIIEKKKIKKDLMIVGGIRELEDGETTFIINGITTYELDESEEELIMPRHKVSKRVRILGGIKILPNGTICYMIDGITKYSTWEEGSERKKICKCMKLYQRWQELESEMLPTLEFDEEFIPGEGRRIEDTLLPYYEDIPGKGDAPVPKSVQLLTMPKKYFKIPCEWPQQKVVLKKLLTELAEDGFPLAKLPNSYLLPYFRLWMNWRCGKVLTEKEQTKLMEQSRAFWNHLSVCPMKIAKPSLDLPEKELHSLTWEKINWCRELVRKKTRETTTEMRTILVDKTREFWPTLYPYDMPYKTQLEVFYAYGFSCEPDVLAFRPWQDHEHK